MTPHINQLPISLEELHDQIECEVTDLNRIADHMRSGTFDEFYRHLVDYTVSQMLLIPARCHEQGIAPPDDTDEAQQHISRIAELIALVSDKSPHDVENEMQEVVNNFPVSDVCTSTQLRMRNRLN